MDGRIAAGRIPLGDPLPGGGNRQQLRWQVDEQSKLAREPSTVSIVEAVDPLEPGVDGVQESTIEAVDS